MLHVNSLIPAIESLESLGYSLRVGHEPTLPTVGLLNLMPKKAETEQDFCRMLAASGINLNLVLLKIPGQQYKTTPQEYVDAHYVDFSPTGCDRVLRAETKTSKSTAQSVACSSYSSDTLNPFHIDALIITGAPLEQMPFEEVRYWGELQHIWDWTAKMNIPMLNICWAAQAALYHFYGIDKRPLSQKCFGIFMQRNLAPHHPLMEGLGETFPMPHSRHTEINWGDAEVEAASLGSDHQFLPEGLEVLADSEVGQSIFIDAARYQTFVTGHLEYKADTLDGEYRRDLAKGVMIAPPLHYYIEDNSEKGIDFSWQQTAEFFYRNWIIANLYATSKG